MFTHVDFMTGLQSVCRQWELAREQILPETILVQS